MVTSEELRAWSTIRPGCWGWTAWSLSGSRWTSPASRWWTCPPAVSRHDAARTGGQRALKVKQWTTTRSRDLPVGGRTVRLRWRKRRWYCSTPGCPRKSFTE
nr:transposase family protein [Micromonospora sp. CB01531]